MPCESSRAINAGDAAKPKNTKHTMMNNETIKLNTTHSKQNGLTCYCSLTEVRVNLLKKHGTCFRVHLIKTRTNSECRHCPIGSKATRWYLICNIGLQSSRSKINKKKVLYEIYRGLDFLTHYVHKTQIYPTIVPSVDLRGLDGDCETSGEVATESVAEFPGLETVLLSSTKWAPAKAAVTCTTSAGPSDDGNLECLTWL